MGNGAARSAARGSSAAVATLPRDAVVVAKLSWDASAPGAADADLQAVAVDKTGRIVDAAYYNNMKACGGRALVHSGDEGGAAGGQGCEQVRFTLASMPADIHMVLVVVCSFTGSVLSEAPGIHLSFEQVRPTEAQLADLPVGAACPGLLAAAVIRGQGGAWEVAHIGEQLSEARHFMDCLDELNRYIVSVIPTANRRQKVAFEMEKGGNVDFGSSQDRITLGLGWDVHQGEVDLDASAVIMGAGGEVLESIFFANTSSKGEHSAEKAVEHSGDNQTGEGEGDDESIQVNLPLLGPAVQEVFFCIHIYSKDTSGRPKTFRDVANPYCRVVEAATGMELCKYILHEAGDQSGLVVARLRRGADGRFGFNALGTPSRGTMYKDAIPDMQRLSQVDPRQMQSSGPGAAW